MKFTPIHIPIKNENQYYLSFSYPIIEPTDVVLLVIANLHLQQKITDEKMKGMIASLRNKTLLRTVKTHHSKINDKWYNDQPMSYVLLDVYHTMCRYKEIDLEEFIPYINLYLNKNRNFCIDYIFFNFVQPYLNQIEDYIQVLNSFGILEKNSILSFDEADRIHSLSGGHCCEDCDGSLYDYKKSNYKHNYLNGYKKEADKKLRNYLLAKKSVSAYKNKNEKLGANSWMF